MKLLEEKNSKHLTMNLLSILLKLIVIAGVIFAFIYRLNFHNESQTTKLGFEDIDELSTESCYNTSIETIDGSRDLFGVEIPFTQSKYIYSYGVTVKAGLHFNKINVTVNDQNKKISVQLPEIYITSQEIDKNSFKVYYEKESIFKKITLNDINNSYKDLENQAVQTAIDNGILDKAKENAKEILKGFISKTYDLNEYEIVYN